MTITPTPEQLQRLIEVLAGELEADNGQPGDRELLAVRRAERAAGMSAGMGAVA